MNTTQNKIGLGKYFNVIFFIFSNIYLAGVLYKLNKDYYDQIKVEEDVEESILIFEDLEFSQDNLHWKSPIVLEQLKPILPNIIRTKKVNQSIFLVSSSPTNPVKFTSANLTTKKNYLPLSSTEKLPVKIPPSTRSRSTLPPPPPQLNPKDSFVPEMESLSRPSMEDPIIPYPLEHNSASESSPRQTALLGILENGNLSLAWFNINGVSQTIYLGEKIGSTNWNLIEVQDQQVKISNQNRTRFLSIGDGI